MKKAVFFFVFLLLAGTSVFSQEPQSVLWEISGKGIKKNSYLFGTIHVGSIALLDSFPQLKQIAESADFAVFEGSGSQIGDAPVSVKTTQPPLDSLFTPEEYALVDSFFIASPHGSIRPHNDDADLFGMIQVAITINQQRANAQYDSFDNLIYARLINLQKPVFHLDIQSDIERIKEEITYQILAKYLVLYIKDKASVESALQSGEIDFEMYSKTMRNPLKLGEKVHKLLENATIERNIKWIPKIEHQMKLGSCFIAVGLGHLKYQTGLIQLLKKQGYTLKPVNL